MDFEEDRLALEAYIREKTLWRDEDEVSPEEWSYYANEYMRLNPIPCEFVIAGGEFVFYQRWSGEFIAYKTSLFIPFAWESGKFWKGQKEGFLNLRPCVFVTKLLEYVGLIPDHQFYPPEFETAGD